LRPALSINALVDLLVLVRDGYTARTERPFTAIAWGPEERSRQLDGGEGNLDAFLVQPKLSCEQREAKQGDITKRGRLWHRA
jgi:hypothetical protein